MTQKQNKHGLSRNIPSFIKREVRKRCGFGCVICGCAIYDYEHVEPEFFEAKEHEPAKIALLCGSCHDKVTRRLWSKNRVKTALQKPKCLQKGFSFGEFDIDGDNIEVVFACTKWINTSVVLEVFDDALLKIEPPEEAGTPFRLSAWFYDLQGNEVFRIIQNQWQGSISNWDIEFKGSRIIIRNAPYKISLVMRVKPPTRLIVEKLEMFYKGCRIIGDETQISIINEDGSTFRWSSQAKLSGSRYDVGISIGEYSKNFYIGFGKPIYGQSSGINVTGTINTYNTTKNLTLPPKRDYRDFQQQPKFEYFFSLPLVTE